ncbi:hypothetical protein BASA81_004128 [Batrachochytrium salamandrivorans]|nr:hypothetical protein BASA81_004128 [Batrachochytrium salamandrivorans]
MAQALPFLKLGVLLVKQASKPLARFVKTKAGTNEYVGRVCHFVGQTWHSSTTRLHYMVQGHRVKTVKPLNEQEAVASGSELLCDGFVLGVGVGALILEAKRSARSAAEKASQKAARQHAKIEAMMHLDVTLKDLGRPRLLSCSTVRKWTPAEQVAAKQMNKDMFASSKDSSNHEKDAWIEAGKSTWWQVAGDSLAKGIKTVGAIWAGADEDGGDVGDFDFDDDSIFENGGDD